MNESVKNITNADINSLLIRPKNAAFAVYMPLGMNRAETLFTGSPEACRAFIKDISKAQDIARTINSKGAGVTAEVITVAKNNDTVKVGIKAGKDGASIQAIAYMTDGLTAAAILADLDKTPDIDQDSILQTMTDPGRLLAAVKPRLVKAEQAFTAGYIHAEFLNMAVLFYIESGIGTITLTPQATTLTADALLPAAIRNIEPKIKSMAELLGLPADSVPMYVMTNDKRLFAAAGMLKTDVLSGTAEMLNDDLIILPSSVHDVIILPARYNGPGMIELVKTINGDSNIISPEEVLTDNVYRYDRKTGKIEIIA